MTKINCKLFAFSMSVNIIMTKPRSPHEVRITTDKEDTHFTIVELVRRGTGVTVCSHYILKSDMATWISMYEADNFKILVEQNNEDNG